MRFGAGFRFWTSYGDVRFCDISNGGAVWCCFQKSGTLRCGSVRFSDVVNPTVRFGAVAYRTLRFDAVPHWTFFSMVRLHSPQEMTYNTVFSLRCTVRMNRTKPRFLTVLALILGARTKQLFYIFSTVHRMSKPYNLRVRTALCRFFTCRQSHQEQQVLGAFKNRIWFNKSIRTCLSVKDKLKLSKVHDVSRDNVMCGLDCMKCKMRGRYSTWLSGASCMFPDLSDVTLNAAHCHLSCIVHL